MTEGRKMFWSMPWDPDRKHEGMEAWVRPDGEVVPMYVPIEDEDGEETYELRDPEDSLVGWVAICSCGWVGQPVKRVLSLADDDLSLRQAYHGGLGPEHDLVSELFAAEWHRHADPLIFVEQIRRETREIEKAMKRRDFGVQEARAAGVSWAEIGKAAGMTRQSAQERWGKGLKKKLLAFIDPESKV